MLQPSWKCILEMFKLQLEGKKGNLLRKVQFREVNAVHIIMQDYFVYSIWNKQIMSIYSLGAKTDREKYRHACSAVFTCLALSFL